MRHLPECFLILRTKFERALKAQLSEARLILIALSRDGVPSIQHRLSLMNAERELRPPCGYKVYEARCWPAHVCGVLDERSGKMDFLWSEILSRLPRRRRNVVSAQANVAANGSATQRLELLVASWHRISGQLASTTLS